MFKKVLVTALSLQLMLPMAYADSLSSGFARPDDIEGAANGSVFVSGQQPGAVLIKVNLWGSVSRSGIHYVPHKTDFVTLLSYAGGPNGKADLDEAYIKRRTKDTEQIIPVNIRDIVGDTGAGHNPVLEPNDIIVIPEIEPTISDNTVLTTGFVATVFGLILSSIVLSEKL